MEEDDIPYTKQQLVDAAKKLYYQVEELKAENIKLKKELDYWVSTYKFIDSHSGPAIGGLHGEW